MFALKKWTDWMLDGKYCSVIVAKDVSFSKQSHIECNVVTRATLVIVVLA